LLSSIIFGFFPTRFGHFFRFTYIQK